MLVLLTVLFHPSDFLGIGLWKEVYSYHQDTLGQLRTHSQANLLLVPRCQQSLLGSIEGDLVLFLATAAAQE